MAGVRRAGCPQVVINRAKVQRRCKCRVQWEPRSLRCVLREGFQDKELLQLTYEGDTQAEEERKKFIGGKSHVP